MGFKSNFCLMVVLVFLFVVAPSMFFLVLLLSLIMSISFKKKEGNGGFEDPEYEKLRKARALQYDIMSRKRSKDALVIKYDEFIWWFKDEMSKNKSRYKNSEYMLELIIINRNQVLSLDHKALNDDEFYNQLDDLDIIYCRSYALSLDV